MPADHPCPMRQTFNGATLDFEVSADIVTGITVIGQRQSTALFMTVRPCPMQQTFNGATLDFELSANIVTGITVIGQQQSTKLGCLERSKCY